MSYSDDSIEKSSVFEAVLRPRFRPDSNKRKSIQIEIHVFISPEKIEASILLNKLRLIGIFDLIMELKSFIFDKLPMIEEGERERVRESERERERERERESETERAFLDFFSLFLRRF